MTEREVRSATERMEKAGNASVARLASKQRVTRNGEKQRAGNAPAAGIASKREKRAGEKGREREKRAGEKGREREKRDEEKERSAIKRKRETEGGQRPGCRHS